MAVSVTIRDETTSGQTTNEFVLDFLTEHLTVRELIRSRVYQEVQDHNRGEGRSADGRAFAGLVQPAHSTKQRAIDWQEQVEKACDAFEANQLLILVGNAQVDRLDQEITITPGLEVSFLKLTPLVGG